MSLSSHTNNNFGGNPAPNVASDISYYYENNDRDHPFYNHYDSAASEEDRIDSNLIPSHPPEPWRRPYYGGFGLGKPVKNINRQGEVLVGVGIIAAIIIFFAVILLFSGTSSSLDSGSSSGTTVTLARSLGDFVRSVSNLDEATDLCYRAVAAEDDEDGVTWAEAETDCQRRFPGDGHLATADTKAKIESVKNALVSIGALGGPSWIGVRSRKLCSSHGSDLCKKEDLYWADGGGGSGMGIDIPADFDWGLHGAVVFGGGDDNAAASVVGLGGETALGSYVCQTRKRC